MLPRLTRSLQGMDDLDRQKWTAGLAVTAYGLSIGIRTDTPEILDLVRALLPFGWKQRDNPAVGRLYSLVATKHSSIAVYADADPITGDVSLPVALETLARDMRIFVAEHARNRTFIHAGAVGWNGRAIVIPGRSLSGKTTLTAALVQAGATYYSDEFAVLDREGRVHPFLKPLSMRESGGYEQVDLPIEALAGTPGSHPLAVGLFVIAEYRAGARWRPSTLTRGEGVLALLSNAVAARHRPEAVVATLHRAAEGAAFLQGKRGEAREVVHELLLHR